MIDILIYKNTALLITGKVHTHYFQGFILKTGNTGSAWQPVHETSLKTDKEHEYD